MCKNSYIAFLFFTLFAVSCTSAIRFTSNKINSQKSDLVKSREDKTNSTQKKQSANSIKQKKQYFGFDNSLNDFEQLVINESKKWIGTPYKYGGNDRSGIDCSGFVKNVYSEVGFDLPRTAENQYEFSSPIRLSSANVGDLVFFEKNKKITHVGIYLGGESFIHSSTSRGVILSNLSDKWYKEHFHSVGRIKF